LKSVVLFCVHFSKEIAKEGIDVAEEAVEESKGDTKGHSSG